MARYANDDLEYLERSSRHGRPSGHVDYVDSREQQISTLAPAYVDEYHRTSSRGVGALVRQPPPQVVEEPVVEHEHHHVHHHIDHGDVNSRLGLSSMNRSRPMGMNRQYSFDDLDVKSRRFADGTSVTQVHHEHDRRHRHRHRHRSRSSRWQNMESRSSRFTRSELDIDYRRSSGGVEDDYFHDDYTIVDVPPGTRRVYVNIDQGSQMGREREREREFEVDWRREHGVRRSRGMGNELWTEITKDLVTREAIEELGYQYEETDYFYYVFDYLDREELAELRELTEIIRRERAKDLQYQSISGDRTPRMLAGGPGSMRGMRDMRDIRDFEVEDSRTEIIIENGGGSRRGSRRKYYNY